jgi:hypothetical protein
VGQFPNPYQKLRNCSPADHGLSKHLLVLRDIKWSPFGSCNQVQNLFPIFG